MKTTAEIQKNTPFTKVFCTFRLDTKEHTAKSVILKAVYADILLSGAGGLRRVDFLEKLKNLGSKISIEANDERVTLSIVTLNENLEKTLKLTKDIIEQPNFEPAELKRIKELTHNQLVLAKENARYQSDRSFLSLGLKKTDVRYPFSIKDLLEALPNATISELKQIHSLVRSSEWNISVGGKQRESRDVISFFEKIHEKHASGEKLIVAPLDSVPLKKHRVVYVDLPSKQNIELNIGSTLPLTSSDKDYPAFYFGLAVLGLQGGFAGRLMSTVREKEGLTYGIYCVQDFVTKTNTGLWRVKTFFSPQDSKKGLLSTLREIRKIKDKGITNDELARFKSILNTRLVLEGDSLLKKLSSTHQRLVHNVSDKEFEAFKQRLQKLTLKEVNTALKKYLDPSKLAVSAAGPVSSVKADIEKIFS